MKLFGIKDRLTDNFLVYYPSSNEKTALREFTNFILDTKKQSPMIDLESFLLYDLGEINEDSKIIVDNALEVWNNLQKQIDTKE